MPAFTALFALCRIFAIAVPDNPPESVIVRVPYLPAENLSARTADDPASKGIAGCRILKLLNAVLQGEIPPALHLKLYRFPHFFVNNGGMAIFHIILRHLPIVVCSLFAQKINGVGFLKESVALIFLIGKHFPDTAFIPFGFAIPV